MLLSSVQKPETAMHISPLFLSSFPFRSQGLPGGSMVKNPPASAGDARHLGCIAALRRLPGGGNASCSSILAWEIPWTEAPGRLQSTGSQRVGHSRATEHAGHHRALSRVAHAYRVGPHCLFISYRYVMQLVVSSQGAAAAAAAAAAK